MRNTQLLTQASISFIFTGVLPKSLHWCVGVILTLHMMHNISGWSSPLVMLVSLSWLWSSTSSQGSRVPSDWWIGEWIGWCEIQLPFPMFWWTTMLSISMESADGWQWDCDWGWVVSFWEEGILEGVSDFFFRNSSRLRAFLLSVEGDFLGFLAIAGDRAAAGFLFPLEESKEKAKDPAVIERLKLTPCITSALVNSRQWVARGSWSLSITGGVAILAEECSSHSGGAHTALTGGHEPTESCDEAGNFYTLAWNDGKFTCSHWKVKVGCSNYSKQPGW